MDVYLLRHGESEANAGLTDNLDSELTPLGKRQADLSAQRLARIGIDTILVSPLRRTLETAAPIAELTHARTVAYPDACEYFSTHFPAFLQFAGLSPDEIRSQFPFVSVDAGFPCPQAWWPSELENDYVMYDRAVRVRDYLQRTFGASNQHVLVVSHAETVGRLVEAFQDQPPNLDGPPWIENCGLTLICAGASGPGEVVFLNDTTHLDVLAADAPR